MAKKASKYKHSSRLVNPLSLLILFCLGSMFSHCARVVAPSGGPKDTLPPVLLSSTPPDSTLHYDADKITFIFNEFIKLKDLQKQMIISPTPKRKPEINYKLDNLTVDWFSKDSLSPNTTYIINLGNAIVDVNEGNALEGFRYVFSTGDHLDSLEISGRVIDSRTGLPDSTAIVMLYSTIEDSIVRKEKPVYYVRCDGGGHFRFQNLPVDTFKIFALQDENGDLKYIGNEKIAYKKNPIQLDSSQSGYLLPLFYAEKPKEENEKKENKKDNKKDTLRYATSLSGKTKDLKQPLVFTFNHPLKTLKESAITLQEDTTYKDVPFKIKRDTTFSEELKIDVDSSMNRDTTILKDTAVYQIELHYNWKANTPYRLILDSTFAIDTLDSVYHNIDTLDFKTKAKSDYGTLILQFDKSSLYQTNINTSRQESATIKDQLSTDSLPPNDSMRHVKDSLIATTDSLSLDSLPKADSLTRKDSLSKVDSLSTEQPTSTDSLIANHPHSAEDTSFQLLIELYKNDEMIYSSPLEGDTWKKPYLEPGEYKIRVVKDVNKNGKWDRGCYFCKEKRQPEKVYSFPDAFKVRANWENANQKLKIKFARGKHEE